MEKSVLLIADDVEMNRSVIKRFFCRNYEVLEAEDGRIALDIMATRRVDILLLDIVMPEINGLEVLKYVREELKLDNVGILVATSTKEKTERHALQLGADDIVSKPYDPTVIKKRMENIMAKKKLEREIQLSGSPELREQAKAEYLTDLKEGMKAELDYILKTTKVIQDNLDNQDVIEECAKHIQQRAAKIMDNL